MTQSDKNQAFLIIDTLNIDRRFHKKLRKFLDIQTSAQNKFQVVVYFTHKCTDESANNKVYSTFKREIFEVLLENYDAYLLQLKQKGKSHESEVLQYTCFKKTS